ncbi:MAG TPA: ABC transporter ATP-binding protein [Solirubrobacteraceae bacterium]|jgi:ABC-type lipoprotein export system ATPase subunit
MLRAEGIVKTYRGSATPVPVLSGVDVSAEAGALTVIAGASGSGKSTLLNVLGLLEDADAGTVWYGDVPVSTLSRRGKSRYRGRSVGFVFQAFLLLPSLTAVDNVLLAGRYVGRARTDGRRRALMLLEQFGVAPRAAHYPRELSGGEQQRVAFCRALFNDPPLLLADEPTGNLDDVNGALILQALRARAQAGGAVVVVTHRPDVIAGADAVYALEHGRLRRR